MKQATITKIAAIVAAVLTVLTICAVVTNIRANNTSQATMASRIESVAAAGDIAASSAGLTRNVRAFTSTGNRQWLQNYWT